MPTYTHKKTGGAVVNTIGLTVHYNNRICKARLKRRSHVVRQRIDADALPYGNVRHPTHTR